MQRFYFDHNATTPVSPAVLEVLVPALLEVYGNASSIHQDGQLAQQRLESARRETAGLLGCDPKEICLLQRRNRRPTIWRFSAWSVRESRECQEARHYHRHRASRCLESCRRTGARRRRGHLRRRRIDWRRGSGRHPPRSAAGHGPDFGDAREQRSGHDSADRGNRADRREAGVPLHSDGVQAAGKIPVDVQALGVDLYSISGHKIYAPKGVGALYVKAGTQLAPMLFGGRHERERRAGTENVPGAVALGRGCQWRSQICDAGITRDGRSARSSGSRNPRPRPGYGRERSRARRARPTPPIFASTESTAMPC